MSARRELYAFAMKGKYHSPDNSERMSALIDAFAHELAEKIRNHVGPHYPYWADERARNEAADLIDPEAE